MTAGGVTLAVLAAEGPAPVNGAPAPVFEDRIDPIEEASLGSTGSAWSGGRTRHPEGGDPSASDRDDHCLGRPGPTGPREDDPHLHGLALGELLPPCWREGEPNSLPVTGLDR